jgi:hypothetical protein
MSEASGRWTAADFGGDTELFGMIERIIACVSEDEDRTMENIATIFRGITSASESATFDEACDAIFECTEASDGFPSEEEWRRWSAAADALRNFD